jgi:hypothetical protein
MVYFMEYVLGLVFRGIFLVIGAGMVLISGNGFLTLFRARDRISIAIDAAQIDAEISGTAVVASPYITIGAVVVLYYLFWLLVGGVILFFAGRSFFRHLLAGPRTGSGRSMSSGEKIRGIIIYGIGGLFFGFLLVMRVEVLAYNVALNVLGESTPATVTDRWEVKTSDLPREQRRNAGYFLKYRYDQNGQTFTGQTRVPRDYWKVVGEGAVIDLIFFPGDPAEAKPYELHNFRRAGLFAFKTLVFLVLTLIGLARFWECLTYDDSGPAYQRVGVTR